MKDLNSMINKWKKVSKDNADQLRKRNDRKYRVRKKKSLVYMKKDISGIEKIGE